uniref:NADH-ubiquinone oxidoreductase chain 5 n=1 Tax=Statilia sp. FY-2016a TaxID=1848996 RepID=A0A172QHL4_9NEOP|nr:NADH dehydrogenase subunit 5 [Statilia flavobrunnea]AND97191.1 NADH dehydrogenase subunit 5 [Statilia sp. FY-2016a]UUF67548.1 NADH dehydrogenase subunit 5 [Statilia flavobrunnea]
MYFSLCFISFFSLLFFSLLNFMFSIYCIMNDMSYFIEWEIVSLNSSSIVMTLLLDWMSLLFMSFVTLISSLVILYSEDYMFGDVTLNRFIFLVLMFVLSMMFLIISPNLISILLGWDGLGLVSYCLVIYYQNVKSYNAGMLTALSNRVGDVALLMAIAWMLNFGSWNYIYYLDCMMNKYELYLITVLVVLAGMTKSAQIPFSAWLPAAMAAPTPVSALVHSSTLVTAGVYLLIRFSKAFPNWLLSFLLVISVLTMFMSGLGANFEYDLKKIIALSTLSQLGLMMSILSLGFADLAFFHLLTHALFKALLFMCAGMVIHNVKNFQDIRFMGNLSLFMPLTSACFMVSNFALCGMPFLAGFYSKDMILEVVSMSNLNMFMYFLYFFSTGLTVCYSFRLFYYVLWGDFNLTPMFKLSEESWMMVYGMLGLMVFAILGGSLLNWMIFLTPYFICLPFFMKMMPIFVSLLGLWLGSILFKYSLNYYFNLFKYYSAVIFSGSMWFMPLIFTKGVNKVPLTIGSDSMKYIDLGWSEYFGAQNLYYILMKIAGLNQWFQTNDLKSYLVIFLITLILIMFII